MPIPCSLFPLDNITDWGLKQFQDHYNDTNISKDDIFHYTYAVLHDPNYREKVEWILDQYKEKKPKNSAIAQYFHIYRFFDYKETVIDLIQRICIVSIETVKITQEMDAI